MQGIIQNKIISILMKSKNKSKINLSITINKYYQENQADNH